MGSAITLDIGRVQLDWGKNRYFSDHSGLFLAQDRKTAIYYYADSIRERKPAYVRKLASIKHRLELLGYTIEGCRRRYNDLLANDLDFNEEPPFDFEQIAQTLSALDVDELRLPDNRDCFGLGEYFIRTLLGERDVIRNSLSMVKRERGLESLFEILDPYIVLRLLAENPSNLDKAVVWRFADIVDGGWVAENQLFQGLGDFHRYLVVTEGSSDSEILKRSLNTLLPDISDFFYFVDMSEHYPFTGTGNLLRFCQGLARIRIQNRILVVIDNDTAGNEVFGKLRLLEMPAKMTAVVLPSLAEFQSFPTKGPSGASSADVNGKAVSVEMFLDLGYGTQIIPGVRWTSFNQGLGQYQGELMNKEEYTRLYLNKGWRDRQYDSSKLRRLWDYLIRSCTTDVS